MLDSDLNPWTPSKDMEPADMVEYVKAQINSAVFLTEEDKVEMLDTFKDVNSKELVTLEFIQNAVKATQLEASSKTLLVVDQATSVLKRIEDRKVAEEEKAFQTEMDSIQLDNFTADEKQSLVNDLMEHAEVKDGILKIAQEINTLKKDLIALDDQLRCTDDANLDFDSILADGVVEMQSLIDDLERVRETRVAKLTQIEENLRGTQYSESFLTQVAQLKVRFRYLFIFISAMYILTDLMYVAFNVGIGTSIS